MEEPKFKIGQFVWKKQDLALFDFAKPKGFDMPGPYMVIDILQETCYAGTQIHYGLRAYNFQSNQSVIQRFSEIELTDKFEKVI